MPCNSSDIIGIQNEEKLLILKDIIIDGMHNKLCKEINPNIIKEDVKKEISKLVKENKSIGVQQIFDELSEVV